MDPYKFRPSSAYDTPFWTTNGGAPVSNNNSVLTVGPRGPILLEDYHAIEKLANFTRERIPERVVHARGMSAKGFFEVTQDVTHLTCADFLRAPGVQTPVIVRFSTVIHERGSPETLRDPRGFATKFYTREGNFDIVGNNFPVFFIRDGIKFPDVVHAFKPNPKSHIQEYWRIFDFLSHHPESLSTFAWFFDDVGIPQDYRHMEGFGVHTYTLINKAGKTTYVKWHWKPTCGVKSLMDDEAQRIGGANHSHATQDLYDSIAAGNYPEWKLCIQTMDPADEDKFDFDPLDMTKIWPEDMFPLQEIGRLVLNRNIDNWFAENEMLAFDPGLVVPGIYYSQDKLFQLRTFAYADTQRHRLGPNYKMLPVNAPKCPYKNNHFDGAMNFMHRDEEVDYFQSRYAPTSHAEQVPIPNAIISGGRRMKTVIPKECNFKQPGERYRSWAPDRQERFLCRLANALSEPRISQEIRGIWVSWWAQCDQALGQKLASRLNVRPNI
ncbi:Catalase [Euphorbia peplus]|nr:Catalase [Euphorbia peplus]